MFFTSRASNSSKENNGLIIDVGTSGIRAMLYSGSADALGEGTGTGVEVKEIIELPHDPLPVVEEKLLLRGIKSDIREIKKRISSRIDLVTVILSSPWYFSQSRIINMSRPDNFLIDKKLVGSLLDEEKNLFLNRASAQFLLDEGDEPELLETAIMMVVLNGYETEIFMDKRVKQMKLFLYISMTMKSLSSELNSLIEDTFGAKKIVFRSSPYIIFKAASPGLGVDGAGAIIADIGGEITDIYVISHGILKEIASFGRGLHFVLRRIAGAQSVTPAEAQTLLRAEDSGHMAGDRDSKLSLVINDAFKEWQTMWMQAVAKISESGFLPRRSILIGEGADYAYFANAIKAAELNQVSGKAPQLKVESFYPKEFRKHLEGEGRLFGASPAFSRLFCALYSPEKAI